MTQGSEIVDCKEEEQLVPKTRAKFTCYEVGRRIGWGNFEFVFAAKFHIVSSGSEENKLFFASTPSGIIEMTTIRSDHFEVGKDYYVDFTLAE